VIVEILDSSKQNLVPYIVFGIISVTYGLAIYYLLPKALLSFNFKLILEIFFFILVGMLLGLTMLAFNIQRVIEMALTEIFLICECACCGRFQLKGVKRMVIMNLQAHRMRNKMTSLIYSMSLGFIIFLIVSYKLQINSTEIIELGKEGGYLTLSAKDKSLIMPLTFDAPMKFNK